MLSLHRRTWPRLYVDCIREATREGYARPSREGETIELGPGFLSCPNPVFVELKGRGGSGEFARLEQLCYLGGLPPDALVSVAPKYARFQEKDGRWYGAYGPRLFFDMHDIVLELDRHPFSRRAVALVWDKNVLNDVVTNPPKDVPCTVSLTYWVGPAGEIRSHAAMRSCDLWFGLYYDLPAFGFLQRSVARALGRASGPTYLTASSLHLYNKDLDRAKLVQGKILPGAKPVHPVLPSTFEGHGSIVRWRELVHWAQSQLTEGVKDGTPVLSSH